MKDGKLEVEDKVRVRGGPLNMIGMVDGFTSQGYVLVRWSPNDPSPKIYVVWPAMACSGSPISTIDFQSSRTAASMR